MMWRIKISYPKYLTIWWRRRAEKHNRAKAPSPFATDVPTLKDMAKFCKMVHRQPCHEIGVMMKDDGNLTSSTEESLDIVMDNAFPNESWNSQYTVQLRDLKGLEKNYCLKLQPLDWPLTRKWSLAKSLLPTFIRKSPSPKSLDST